MAATLILGPTCVAILSILKTSPAVTMHVPAGNITDQLASPPDFPAIVVEHTGEQAFNTMGLSPRAFGSEARPSVRILSQWRGDSEINAISAAVRGVLDGQRIDLPPYGRPILTFETASPIMKTTVGLVVTREQVAEFDLEAHE